MILLTAGALTFSQLPATASNVCTTDARLVESAGCPTQTKFLVCTPSSSSSPLYSVWGRRIKFPFSMFYGSVLLSLCSFLLRVFRIISFHLSFGHPSLCAHSFPSSTFSLLHLLQSFSPHVHLSFASLIFSLTFSTPGLSLISTFLFYSILFIPISHLNVLIS